MALFRLFLAGFCALLGAALVIPVMVAGVPFLVVSYLTRRLARLVEPQYVPWSDLIEYDPRVGWKSRGTVRSWHLADDVFWSSTDPDGWRDGRARLGESEMIVIGDSFAWGHGIDDRDFFARLLRTPRVKAIGANGYSMVQELLWMRELAHSLRGKVVVWLVYLGNDLYENLAPSLGEYRRPFVRQLDGTGEWEIVTRHINRRKWPLTPEVHLDGVDYYRKIAEICSETMFAERAFSASAWLMRQGRDLCRSAGAHLVVMSIPDSTQLTPKGREMLRARGGDPASFDPSLPDRKLRTICANLRIAFVPGAEYFRPADYKERDSHWNRAGHRRMADVLADVYRTRIWERDECRQVDVDWESRDVSLNEGGCPSRP